MLEVYYFIMGLLIGHLLGRAYQEYKSEKEELEKTKQRLFGNKKPNVTPKSQYNR
jgi:hypothetical protein